MEDQLRLVLCVSQMNKLLQTNKKGIYFYISIIMEVQIWALIKWNKHLKNVIYEQITIKLYYDYTHHI